MTQLDALVQAARTSGTTPDPAAYYELQQTLREAMKTLSNKSSVAVRG